MIKIDKTPVNKLRISVSRTEEGMMIARDNKGYQMFCQFSNGRILDNAQFCWELVKRHCNDMIIRTIGISARGMRRKNNLYDLKKKITTGMSFWTTNDIRY